MGLSGAAGKRDVFNPARHTDTDAGDNGRVLWYLFPTLWAQPQPGYSTAPRLLPSLALVYSVHQIAASSCGAGDKGDWRTIVPHQGLIGGGHGWRYPSTVNLFQSLAELTTLLQPQISMLSSHPFPSVLNPCPFNPSSAIFPPTLRHPLFFRCGEKGRSSYSPGSLPISYPARIKGQDRGELMHPGKRHETN
jgi:hypothetical protein